MKQTEDLRALLNRKKIMLRRIQGNPFRNDVGDLKEEIQSIEFKLALEKEKNSKPIKL